VAADGFDGLVLQAARAHLEARRQALDGLVVDAVDPGAAQTGVHPGQPGAGLDVHRVVVAFVDARGEVGHRRPVLGGQVLEQAAAEGHVEDLQPAADAEHRLARGHEGMDQRHLVLVAHRVAGPLGPQGLFAIALRRHVGPALQHQPIERRRVGLQLQGLARLQAARGHRRHHHRHRVLGHQPQGHRLFQVVQRLGPHATQVQHRAVGVVDAGGDTDQQGAGGWAMGIRQRAVRACHCSALPRRAV
jgi:hypothetical protein